MKRLLFPLAASLALGCAVLAQAFSYQGVLADIDGNPLTPKTQTVEFRLYASETGGTALWGCQRSVQLDDNGMFNTEIADGGATVPSGVPENAVLDDVLAANAQDVLWMGITVVGSAGEIAPRLCLLPVPYAVFAHNVSKATGDFAAAGKVSAAQMAVGGDATFGAGATVTGDAPVEGNLTVSGTVSGYGSVPVGTIVLWSGSANDIPAGWHLCNGDENTPDLRGRFVVGHDPRDSDYAVKKTGGEPTHRLTTDEMPSHRHSYTFKGADLDGAWDSDNYFYDQSGKYDGNGYTKYTDYTGGSQPHENRPPFYALCYIMRVR